MADCPRLDRRVDPEVELVDKAGLDQFTGQLAAAGHDETALERRTFLRVGGPPSWASRLRPRIAVTPIPKRSLDLDRSHGRLRRRSASRRVSRRASSWTPSSSLRPSAAHARAHYVAERNRAPSVRARAPRRRPESSVPVSDLDAITSGAGRGRRPMAGLLVRSHPSTSSPDEHARCTDEQLA